MIDPCLLALGLLGHGRLRTLQFPRYRVANDTTLECQHNECVNDLAEFLEQVFNLWLDVFHSISMGAVLSGKLLTLSERKRNALLQSTLLSRLSTEDSSEHGSRTNAFFDSFRAALEHQLADCPAILEFPP